MRNKTVLPWREYLVQNTKTCVITKVDAPTAMNAVMFVAYDEWGVGADEFQPFQGRYTATFGPYITTTEELVNA